MTPSQKLADMADEMVRDLYVDQNKDLKGWSVLTSLVVLHNRIERPDKYTHIDMLDAVDDLVSEAVKLRDYLRDNPPE